MDADEAQAREHAAQLCKGLRDRGDTLSLNAAAEIEGTLAAFAGLVAAQRVLRERLASAERNLRATQDLWSQVPQHLRFQIAHGARRTACPPLTPPACGYSRSG